MDTFTVCRAAPSVRERRDALGLSRQQIAQLAGCSLTHVGRFETDSAPVRSKVLTRILAVLDRLEASACVRGTLHNDDGAPGQAPRVITAADGARADVLHGS